MVAIVAQQPEPTTITFGNWPLADATSSTKAIPELVYEMPEAVSFFDTKSRSTAVFFEFPMDDRSPICLGSAEGLRKLMELYPGEGVAAIVALATLLCCRFVELRNIAEACVAGGVAA